MTTLRIREAQPKDYGAVRACVADVFLETASQKATSFGQSLWEWQYLAPERGSVVILAEDSGQVCGYYHAVLTPMLYQGESVLAALIQDVGILRSHRRKGIFRSLGAFALDCFRSHGADFAYGFPNSRSMPSFVRNHNYSILTKVPVYVAPLNLKTALGNRVWPSWLGWALGSVVGSAYRSLRVRRCQVRPEERLVTLDAFDNTMLAATARPLEEAVVTIHRTPDYLNWRFIDKPATHYVASGLARNGEIQAYLVTQRSVLFSTPCTLLMDFGCRDGGEDAWCELVGTHLVAERELGMALAVTMGLHPLLNRLRSLGFLRIPEKVNPRPFNLMVKDISSGARSGIYDPDRWLITLADWDVF